MLSEMMTALASATRTEDLAVRWGGEECVHVVAGSRSRTIGAPTSALWAAACSARSRPWVLLRGSFLLAGVGVLAFVVVSRRGLD